MDDMLKPTSQELLRIWEDQADFNRNFRDPSAYGFAERTAETKELSLHMISEVDELLRASGAWKPHRRVLTLENRRAVGYELADIFKYVISVAQVHGFTAAEFAQFYWEKSMIVRQRYAQEFIQTLDNPAIIVDIDQVLANYIHAFLVWMVDCGYLAPSILATPPAYVSAHSLGMAPPLYDEAKHLWRVSGQHATIPVMPGAYDFLAQSVRDHPERSIIVLTARPIDQYPNLYGETLNWLRLNNLPYHFVWWAADKGDAIYSSRIASNVIYAVDDNWTHVEQFAKTGVRTYWLHPGPVTDALQVMKCEAYANIRRVDSLNDIHRWEESNEHTQV